jgi:hypothetical protein
LTFEPMEPFPPSKRNVVPRAQVKIEAYERLREQRSDDAVHDVGRSLGPASVMGSWVRTGQG